MKRFDLITAYENAIKHLRNVSAKAQIDGLTEEIDLAASNAVKAIAVLTLELEDDLLLGYKAFTLGAEVPDALSAPVRGKLLRNLDKPAPIEVLDALVDLGFVARTNAATMAPSTETTH